MVEINGKNGDAVEVNVRYSHEIEPSATRMSGNSYDLIKSASSCELLENDKHYKCGMLCCKPTWAEIFTKPKWLLVMLCLISFIQGFVVNGVNNVNTTSYERRFQLTAQQASSVSSAYDFSAGVLVLPFSYFGTSAHKPRMLGFASIALGVGSFCMALPHFVTGPYEAGEEVNKLCNATESTCQVSHLSNFLYLLIFGQILHGVAGTILYTVGVGALDDNINNKTSPFYLGIMYGFAALGPAFGYLCGGQFVSLYVDFDQTNNVKLTEDDPRWVGAWWMAFILSFVLSFIAAWLFFQFPRESPDAPQLRLDRAKTNPDGQVQKKRSIKEEAKDFPAATWRLLKKPTFVFISLAGATEGMIASGFATFLPKFIRNQFSQTDFTAALLTGAMGVPGLAGGQFFGGYIVKRTGWGVKGMLRFNAAVCLGVLALSGVLFANCEQTKVSGVNIPYDLNTETNFSMSLESSCNKDCGCNVEYYDPMCINNIEYFTPCYAGCRDQDFVDGKMHYYNCSCVTSHVPLSNATDIHGVAGKCGSSCVYLYVFIPLFFILMVFTFLAVTPASSATLRCVADRDKTYALGVSWVFIRFLGSVPGPLIFGAIIDSVCVLRQKICGVEKSCWIYDNEAMSRYFFLIVLVTKSISILFYLLASWLHQPSCHKVVDDYEVTVQPPPDANDAQTAGQVNDTSHETKF